MRRGAIFIRLHPFLLVWELRERLYVLICTHARMHAHLHTFMHLLQDARLAILAVILTEPQQRQAG
jgi:hypothetical protein